MAQWVKVHDQNLWNSERKLSFLICFCRVSYNSDEKLTATSGACWPRSSNYFSHDFSHEKHQAMQKTQATKKWARLFLLPPLSGVCWEPPPPTSITTFHPGSGSPCPVSQSPAQPSNTRLLRETAGFSESVTPLCSSYVFPAHLLDWRLPHSPL